MKICIVGAGYVGLVTGVCLASRGHQVTCVDKNLSIIEKINLGISPIYEKGLSELLVKVISSGNFEATNNLISALENKSICIIAVGTPSIEGIIDLRYIESVSAEIGKYISNTDRFISVIVKSTVLPGTTKKTVLKKLEESSGKSLGEFGLGMNPEFLREGEAISDFLYPDRIVLGADDIETHNLLKELYDSWDIDKIYTNTRTAEFIKYMNNVLLATQISTVNEIANVAYKMGDVDIMEVVNGVKLDRRWNPSINNTRINPGILNYLNPGCGFGGSCFSKDLQAFSSHGQNLGLKMKIMNAVLETNYEQPHQVVRILENEIGSIENKKIMLLGLAFKPDTDDVRDSPALKIALDILNKDASLYAHDPIAIENFKNAIGQKSNNIKFVNDWTESIKLMDIIIIVAPWKDYFKLEECKIKDKTIFDARRMFDPKKINCLRYLSIGRKV